MNIKKLFKYFICILLILSISSCHVSVKIRDNNDNITFDYYKIRNSEIIFPKNQTDGQSLSIIVKNDKNELIVFDGGRIEDAEYLYNFIKNNGGCVKSWFLTHAHDDHIGALYTLLLNKKYSDIKIETINYNFSNFDFHYKYSGDDAYLILLFEKLLSDYNNISINNHVFKENIFSFDNIKVQVLNDVYAISEDSINNSSIVYKVYVDDSSMIIFGDLGYKGGIKLLDTISDPNILNSDILVLSHHGQNGVPLKLYDYINPTLIIWPTSKDIYNNTNGKFNTNDTKNYFKDFPIELQILTYKKNHIIK